MRDFPLRRGATDHTGASGLRARQVEELRERIAERLQAGFDRELGRVSAERASQAERRLAEEIANRIEAAAKRVRDETAGELKLLAESLKAQLEEARARADEARVARDAQVREEVSVMRAEAEAALATTEAMGEQLQELASALYERHSESLLGKPVARTADGSGDELWIDVNLAAAEDLLCLNLSQTQATRLIKYREDLGGFTSPDQLDHVPGLGKRLRDELKQHLGAPRH